MTGSAGVGRPLRPLVERAVGIRMAAGGLAIVGFALGSAFGVSLLSLTVLIVLIAASAIVVQAPAPAAEPTSSGGHGWETFERELSRARRYNRRLTLIRLEPAGVPPTGGLVEVAAALASGLRAVDLLWEQDGEVWILMPEGDRAIALSAMQRLESVAGDLRNRAIIRSATFPDDALTAGALLSVLHGPSTDPLHLPVRVLAEEDGEESLEASGAETGTGTVSV